MNEEAGAQKTRSKTSPQESVQQAVQGAQEFLLRASATLVHGGPSVDATSEILMGLALPKEILDIITGPLENHRYSVDPMFPLKAPIRGDTTLCCTRLLHDGKSPYYLIHINPDIYSAIQTDKIKRIVLYAVANYFPNGSRIRVVSYGVHELPFPCKFVFLTFWNKRYQFDVVLVDLKALKQPAEMEDEEKWGSLQLELHLEDSPSSFEPSEQENRNLELLTKAINDAFNIGELKRLVEPRFPELHRAVAWQGSDENSVVYDLITTAERHGVLPRLLEDMVEVRPLKQNLRQFSEYYSQRPP